MGTERISKPKQIRGPDPQRSGMQKQQLRYSSGTASPPHELPQARGEFASRNLMQNPAMAAQVFGQQKQWLEPGLEPPDLQKPEEDEEGLLILKAIRAGTGSIQILDVYNPPFGLGEPQRYPGFRNMVILQFEKLISQPVGRRLVTEILNGSSQVTIQPNGVTRISYTAAPLGEGEKHQQAYVDEDGNPGQGVAGVLIQIPPEPQDGDIAAYDEKGNEIPAPVFINLGHELIHARHYSQGIGRSEDEAPELSPRFYNRDEEETIFSGSPYLSEDDQITENDLREEHGYQLRYGHEIRPLLSPQRNF